MSRKGLTKREIYIAADAIAASGIIPTQGLIRDKLATGSHATIAKYLKAWKEQKIFTQQQEPIKQSQDKQLALEALLRQQCTQAATMAQENINLQKQCFALELERDALMQQTAAQATELQQLATQVATGETLLAELKAERQSAIAAIIQDKNVLLAALNQELQHIHSSSLELIRDTSAKGHDLLMEVKVAKINLEEKLKIQTQQLASISKELIEARIAQQSLRQKLKFAEQQQLDRGLEDA